MSNWLLRRVGRFFGREVHCPCIRCGGTGFIPRYSHVQNGICFRCGGDGVDPRGTLRSDQSLEYGEIDARVAAIESAADVEVLEHEQYVDFTTRDTEQQRREIEAEMGRLDPHDYRGMELLQRESEMIDDELQADLVAEEDDFQARMDDLAWEANEEAQAYDDWGDDGYDDGRY